MKMVTVIMIRHQVDQVPYSIILFDSLPWFDTECLDCLWKNAGFWSKR